ncbi:MAG: hypothetical protein AB7Q16_15420 [Vicinamibacterales bacterium]
MSGDAVQITRDLKDIADVRLTADRTVGVATRTAERRSIEIGSTAGGAFSEAMPESAAAPWLGAFDGLGNLFLRGSRAWRRQGRVPQRGRALDRGHGDAGVWDVRPFGGRPLHRRHDD